MKLTVTYTDQTPSTAPSEHCFGSRLFNQQHHSKSCHYCGILTEHLSPTPHATPSVFLRPSVVTLAWRLLNEKSKWLWLLVKVPTMLKPCQIWKVTCLTLSFPSVVLKLWVLGTVECIPSIDISCKFKIRSVECLHDIFLTSDGQVILSNINQSNTFLDWSSNVSWSNKHEHCLNWLVTRMDTPVYKWIISLSDPITIGIRLLPTADGFPGTTFGVWFSWGGLWSSLLVGLFTDGYLLQTENHINRTWREVWPLSGLVEGRMFGNFVVLFEKISKTESRRGQVETNQAS